LALRPRAAAAALGISERTLWAWTQSGGVPHLRIGKAILYPVDGLRRWLDGQSTSSAKTEGGGGSALLNRRQP
jgi:excisionase family DNA binding protein